MSTLSADVHAGLQLICRLDGRSLLGEMEPGNNLDLRAPFVEFNEAKFLEDEAACLKDLRSNESTLAPIAIKETDSVVRLALTTSTYARYRAASKQFAVLPFSIRKEALESGIQWKFSHSLGVNISLETADDKLIFTRRSSAVQSGKGCLALAMNEGAHFGDVSQRAWNPLTTARRGFSEELNLGPQHFDANGAPPIVFHSLIHQLDTAAISVIGHAKTTATSDEVLALHAKALDFWEAEELVVTNKSLEALDALLVEGGDAFASWVSPALIWLKDELGLAHN